MPPQDEQETSVEHFNLLKLHQGQLRQIQWCGCSPCAWRSPTHSPVATSTEKAGVWLPEARHPVVVSLDPWAKTTVVLGPDTQQGQPQHTAVLGLTLNMVAGGGAWHRVSYRYNGDGIVTHLHTDEMVAATYWPCWKKNYLVVYSMADGHFLLYFSLFPSLLQRKEGELTPKPTAWSNESFIPSLRVIFHFALPLPTCSSCSLSVPSTESAQKKVDPKTHESWRMD